MGIGPEFEIHVMAVDGTNDRPITSDRLEDRFPAWLAEGRVVWGKEGTLWSAGADGSDAREIGPGSFPDVWHGP